MTELAKIAKKYDLNIQSHISESLGEIEGIKSKYPSLKDYASVYDFVGLLTDKCVMAHAVHLGDDEIRLLKEKGTSVAHCPTSNLGLKSGLCDVRRLINGGVKVGLGSDVSGGYEVSILSVLRTALAVSQTIEFVNTRKIMGCDTVTKGNAQYRALGYKEAIYLATLGGAEALSLGHKIGNFVVGKEFDALLIDTEKSPIDQYNLETGTPQTDLLKLLQKFIYVGDDRNIVQVFVKGRSVKQ